MKTTQPAPLQQTTKTNEDRGRFLVLTNKDKEPSPVSMSACQHDKLTQVDYNGSSTRKAVYRYGADGNLAQTLDYAAGIRTLPVYDLSGRVVSIREYTGTSTETSSLRAGMNYTYANGTNYITKKTYSVTATGTSWSTSFTYGNAASDQMPDQVYSLSHSNGLKAGYDYDNLGRRTSETIKYNSTDLFTNSYTFKQGYDSSHTTTQVETFTTKNGTSTYTYDANGNITKIVFVPTSGSTKETRYVYDALNRLIREDNPYSNRTYAISYDKNGNVTRLTTYSYTAAGVTPTNGQSEVFTYDSVWKDMLVNYDGQMITYDTIGNPTNIDGNVLQWTGRMLDSYTDANHQSNYTYDISGQRYKKDVDGYRILLCGQRLGRAENRREDPDFPVRRNRLPDGADLQKRQHDGKLCLR